MWGGDSPSPGSSSSGGTTSGGDGSAGATGDGVEFSLETSLKFTNCDPIIY
ncbi:hypothetical protein WME76_31685 [Sorangium sp. So ce119]|uniref:hypothetical protein n=1 Tax=Sorangium sp. So ce119 TaxID=3133279 RepID=UPI003F5FC26F